MECWLLYITMKHAHSLLFLPVYLSLLGLPLDAQPSPQLPAQTPLRLSLQQAVALAVGPRGAASVQLADAAVSRARANVALARSLRYPLLSGNVSESNVTRNLAAEGFTFPTGVPGFQIPDQVGPFNVFDGRIAMNQTVFDLASIRRSRAVGAAFDAASADDAAARETAASQAAHDYLVALASDAKLQCAQSALEQAEAAASSARRDIAAGNASDSVLNLALIELSAARRKLSSAQNAAQQARLQLLDDLGLDFDTRLELTDTLETDSAGAPDLASQIQLALRTRPELRVAGGRELQARDESGAVHAGMLPTVSVFGDVGPQNAVITHTVGVSARIVIFDGGRRKAEEAESAASVRQYEIQQHDLKRKIELDVRRAFADLQTHSSDTRDADSTMTFSQEELARAQRRIANGLGSNADLVNAENREIRAREDRVDAYFAWNQARLDLAQATGTVEQLEMKPAPPPPSSAPR